MYQIKQQTKIISPAKLNNSSVNSNLENIISTNNNINKMGYASLGSLFKNNLLVTPQWQEEEEEINNMSQQAANLSLYGLTYDEKSCNYNNLNNYGDDNVDNG